MSPSSSLFFEENALRMLTFIPQSRVLSGYPAGFYAKLPLAWPCVKSSLIAAGN
jgi:hypothetical protein